MKWTSIRENLPVDGQRVLAVVITGQGAVIKDCYYVEDLVNGMHIACFKEVDSGSTSVFYEVERVTHWTPFPRVI